MPSPATATLASATPAGELARFQRRRRVALMILTCVIFAGLLFVRSALATGDMVHEYIEAVGGALVLTAILGRTWCTLYIGGRKGAEIVTAGPYSVTRNPLYVFSTIGAAGIGAMTGSIIVAAAFAVVTWVAFHLVILVEEEYFERTFGEPYRQYMTAVPRFFPRIRHFKEGEMLSVRPKLLYRTFRDGLVFLAAYPFFEFIEYLQDTGVLPILLRLY